MTTVACAPGAAAAASSPIAANAAAFAANPVVFPVRAICFTSLPLIGLSALCRSAMSR
jgi:hypothetical protein